MAKQSSCNLVSNTISFFLGLSWKISDNSVQKHFLHCPTLYTHKRTGMGNAGHVYILEVHLPKATVTRAQRRLGHSDQQILLLETNSLMNLKYNSKQSATHRIINSKIAKLQRQALDPNLTHQRANSPKLIVTWSERARALMKCRAL